MKIYNLSEFPGGWFVGDFVPSLIRTKYFEVGVKHYQKGQIDALHLHKKAIEITLIISGVASFSGKEVKSGDLIVLEKNEPNEFRAMSDVVLCVVKFPSVPGDKYILNE